MGGDSVASGDFVVVASTLSRSRSRSFMFPEAICSTKEARRSELRSDGFLDICFCSTLTSTGKLLEYSYSSSDVSMTK